VLAHESADVQALAVALVRGAFEYQGQKCSAASRAYIPKGLWPQLSALLEKELAEVRMGSVEDFRNLVNAVIDRKSFDKLKGAIERAGASPVAEIWHGGNCDDSKGYFIEPTIILCHDPMYDTMQEELFGPVLSLYLYEDAEFERALELVDQTSPYALTGAVFAQNRYALDLATKKLAHSAGNFYLNDKPTGAVVGQQPFGGGRASGTNDKAGSILNLYRWISPRTIKETFVPPKSVAYPFMGAE
jgi:1-pyrroline-5-carboxylate dehydrogenase